MTSTEQKKPCMTDWDRFDALVHEVSGEIEQRFLDTDGEPFLIPEICKLAVVYGYILARLTELGREDDALFFAWSVRDTCFRKPEHYDDPRRQCLTIGVFRLNDEQAA